jgi:hypothetical protein
MGAFVQRVHGGTGRFPELIRFSRKLFPIIGCMPGPLSTLTPLVANPAPRPDPEASAEGIYGKLLVTGGNRSVYAWIIYIMHNSLYFICILTGFCQKIFEI